MYIPRVARELYSSAPAAQDSLQDNPTLLVSWWCTGFALAIIIVRLCGRLVRTEKLFREDKVMALSMIPLLLRMGLVHVILKWGTNNAITAGLTDIEIWHREIGSRLVLPSRIMYAAFLWIAKFTITEFLKRLYSGVWKRSYEIGLQIIRWFLIVTFIGVVIATLSECTPFSHYWQVNPDPGPHCRQGYAQLITMGVSDSITDLVLVGFPIPIVIASSMPVKRKVSLTLLFGLSLILVGITIYRVFATIERHSNQQFRSLLASLEILAAAAVANALVLGSFVRDRGVKKQRFKFGSTGGNSSLEKPSLARQRSRAVMSWGSDADLVGDMGIRLGPEFSSDKSLIVRPAPIALPTSEQAHRVTPAAPSWNAKDCDSLETDETDLKVQEIEHTPPTEEVAIITPRRVAFFDVGGLLGDDQAMPFPQRSDSSQRSISPASKFPAQNAQQEYTTLRSGRRGSHALLQDIGGLLDDDKRPPSSQHPLMTPPPLTRNFNRPCISPPLISPTFSNSSMNSADALANATAVSPTHFVDRGLEPLAQERFEEEEEEEERRKDMGMQLKDVSGLLS